MKRGKKLLINIGIIALILWWIYYFGGYYVSKEQCIKETLRGLYAYETEMIMEFEEFDRSITLMADLEKDTYSMVETKVKGFFYQAGTTMTGYSIKDDYAIDVFGMNVDKMGATVFVYRNDKSIAKVEVELENRDTVTLDEWNNDYTGYLQGESEFVKGTYRAYNANDELIAEIEW